MTVGRWFIGGLHRNIIPASYSSWAWRAGRRVFHSGHTLLWLDVGPARFMAWKSNQIGFVVYFGAHVRLLEISRRRAA